MTSNVVLGDATITIHKHCCSPVSVKEQLTSCMTHMYFGHSFTQSCKDRCPWACFGHVQSREFLTDTELFLIHTPAQGW